MKTIKLSTVIILICLISVTCRKDEKEMMVETGSISNIQITSVDISGSVIDLGEGATQHGHCYSKTPNPKLSGSITQLGTPSKGGFTSALTNLEPGTKYYVKAYLSLNENVVYGDEINFTTVAIVLSQITTSTVTSIETTTAKCGGNITADGGASVSARGVCWSKSQNPTTADNKTTDGTGTGTFTSSLSALTASTTYYVRAYATNSAGTSYGTEVSFTTATAVSVPVLTTNVITNITQTSASGGGNITIDGGASITARGVCWSTSENPTIADSKTSDGTGKGSFISNLGSLTVNTTYYVRAYATNSAGTSYGNQVSFTTLQNTVTVPTITTTAISNIAQTTATGGGNISSDGGAPVIARGVCWSTSTNPTIADSKTSDGTGTASYTSNLTSLTANTTYYVRAYATNSTGTAYGTQVNFKTQTQDENIIKFSDDFNTSIANWSNPTGQGSWSLTSGKLIGTYDIVCGSTTCPQADLILNDLYQLPDKWMATSSFTKFFMYSYGGDVYGSYCTFSLWTSSSNKAAIFIGHASAGFTGGNQDSIYVHVQRWNGSWSYVNIPGASKTGRFKYPAGTWNASDLNLASIRKNGTTYKVYLNNQFIAEFDGSFLTAPVKIGYHVYGRIEQESFQLVSTP